MRSAVKVMVTDPDRLWEYRASFSFLCKQKRWKYPDPKRERPSQHLLCYSLISTIDNDGDKPSDSHSSLFSPVLPTTDPRSWLCLLPSAVDLTYCTSHMSKGPNICKLSLKLMTRGAADSLQMCVEYYKWELCVYDDVCVSASVYISIQMSFSTKQRLCRHVTPADIRHIAVVLCSLSPVFTQFLWIHAYMWYPVIYVLI